MIVNPELTGWGYKLEDGYVAYTSVLELPPSRVSEVLGPDGEPLIVQPERRRIGFDLTPRGRP